MALCDVQYICMTWGELDVSWWMQSCKLLVSVSGSNKPGNEASRFHVWMCTVQHCNRSPTVSVGDTVHQLVTIYIRS